MFKAGYVDGNKIKASCWVLSCIRSPGECFFSINGSTLFALLGNKRLIVLQSLL